MPDKQRAGEAGVVSTRLAFAAAFYDEVHAERVRAHEKHGDTSMESEPVDAPLRLTILMEEVGEVAKEFNEARHDGRPVDLRRLRKELIQTAAMASAWADAITVVDHRHCPCGCGAHMGCFMEEGVNG